MYRNTRECCGSRHYEDGRERSDITRIEIVKLLELRDIFLHLRLRNSRSAAPAATNRMIGAREAKSVSPSAGIGPDRATLPIGYSPLPVRRAPIGSLQDASAGDSP